MILIKTKNRNIILFLDTIAIICRDGIKEAELNTMT